MRSDAMNPSGSGKNVFRKSFGGFLLLLWCLVLTACASTGKPQMHVESYLIDYPPPRFEKVVPIAEAVRVDRFTAAGAYNHQRMVFRETPYHYDTFNYHRWAVNPADMIGDGILRDLRASGLLRAVFSRHTLDEGRYVLQGGLAEFFLRIDQSGRRAVIGLDMTLRDMTRPEAVKRILLQKKYHAEEPLKSETPRGYCEAMSLAVERLSRQIIVDVHQVVQSVTAP